MGGPPAGVAAAAAAALRLSDALGAARPSRDDTDAADDFESGASVSLSGEAATTAFALAQACDAVLRSFVHSFWLLKSLCAGNKLSAAEDNHSYYALAP